MDPTGKVALVTGSARRVGRAIALELARAGCDLALHYHTSAEMAQALCAQVEAQGRRARLLAGDLVDPNTPGELVDQIARTLGRLDFLINNASVFEKTPIETMDAGAWERILRVNAMAPAMLARAAAPLMRQGGGGRIVNLADILADRPVRGYDAYCASKAAVCSITRSLALELAPQITVNAIAPGIAMFPDEYDQETRRKLMSRVPLGRQGTPEEVAAVVLFLVTAGDYITGQVIALDGGRSIRL